MGTPTKLTRLIGLGLLAAGVPVVYSAVQAYRYREPHYYPPVNVVDREAVVKDVSPVSSLDNGRWIGSLRTHDGTIYLKGKLKSTDGGRTVTAQAGMDVDELTGDVGLASLSEPGLFYAAGGYAKLVKPGMYQISAWRSTDELKTVRKEEAIVYVPNGPTRDRVRPEWYGLFVHRTLLKMPDGIWLMTMYGNFVDDNLPPQDEDAVKETRFMSRSFVVSSTDRGRTWHYRASIAIPRAGDPVGEGFVEPTMTLLEDGRLLAVMRTGHHFPLYASWSSDAGKTWTAPLYTGLDRACDPHLIRLRDGRLALSWGRRYPEGWSRVVPGGDQSRFKYPGVGFANLAISNDNGRTWMNHKIAQNAGSGYSTIYEVEPNVLFLQVDQWHWRVSLREKSA